MNKPKKSARKQYSAKVQQIIAQMRTGALLNPQAVKDGISRMLDHEMKI